MTPKIIKESGTGHSAVFVTLLLFFDAACPDGLYGADCTRHCRCQNNARCSPHNGHCACEPGFTGRYCQRCKT